MNTTHAGIFKLLRIIAGLLIWASGFVWLYAGSSLACQHLDVAVEAGLANPVTAVLTLISLVHLAALAALLLRHRWRPTGAVANESARSHRLRHWLEGCVLWISMAGLLLIAFPVLMVPPCAG
jgi:hypothetical protein